MHYRMAFFNIFTLQNAVSDHLLLEEFLQCVLLLQNVFSYYRMCYLTTECIFLSPSVRRMLRDIVKNKYIL